MLSSYFIFSFFYFPGFFYIRLQHLLNFCFRKKLKIAICVQIISQKERSLILRLIGG